ncbi:hypothetical protein KAT84_04485 [Candidatus Bipolaricaulota bacterium]|nr:hypothetical protein [Candidatus Bipolaricaulota bacterium]
MKRALVLSLICVLGVAFSGLAATLSGSWDTDVTIDPQQTNFNDAIGLVSVLTVTYTVGDWAFTSVTDLNETGWTDQDFSVAGVLGAFSLSSALDFDPVTPAFGSWNTTAAVSIAGVTFGADFTLYPNDVVLVLAGSGVAGDVTVGVEITFGNVTYVPGPDPEPVAGNGCDLDWAGITIDIGFPFCCADIALEVEFDCDGFVDACFSVVGIAIPNLPYVTLSAELCFTMDEKTLVLTPAFDFGATVCFDLYIDVATEGDHLTLGDIYIYGIGLTCDIGGVTFTGISIWDGSEEYWEVYTISTNDDGCCGPFGFDLAFYFLDDGIRLFDIAVIDANMTLQIASQFTFNMGLEIDVDGAGFTQWTVGFLVTW